MGYVTSQGKAKNSESLTPLSKTFREIIIFLSLYASCTVHRKAVITADVKTVVRINQSSSLLAVINPNFYRAPFYPQHSGHLAYCPRFANTRLQELWYTLTSLRPYITPRTDPGTRRRLRSPTGRHAIELDPLVFHFFSFPPASPCILVCLIQYSA